MSLNDQLFDCFNKQKHCDVWFETNDNSKTTKVGAHKLILSLASDVFEAMFFGKAVKQGLLENETLIRIPDIKPDTFHIFLR